MFSWLADRRLKATGQRTIIFSHRDELCDQAIAEIRQTTGIFADKEKAEFRASLRSPVVVASIPTLLRRMDRWPKDHFGLGVIDECHMCLADGWQKVLKHFDSHADILGVTATPDRGDKRDLGEYFENIAAEIPLLELIHQKYLCPITIKTVPIKIDLSSCSGTGGDFDDVDLGHALEPYLAQIAYEIKRNVGDRKTLCFLPLIATSKKFVEACRSEGILAEHIDGEDPFRKYKLRNFRDGHFQLLSNAMLLTHGYNCPAISCVICLRPTKVRSLFAQIAGRGTRIAEGKENLLLLDLLWLHTKHKIVHPASLIAKSEEEAEVMTQIAAEQCTGLPSDVAAQLPIDLLNLASEAQVKREEALRKKLEALAHRKSKFISADQFALQHGSGETADYAPTMHWHSLPPTEKQSKYLEAANIDLTTVKGTDHASKLLDVYFKVKDKMPANQKVKFMMSKVGWRSADNLRGPWQATISDQRHFFANQPKKPRVAKVEAQKYFF